MPETEPNPVLPSDLPTDLRFDERGLVPVVAQDLESGRVLMLAYANREALELTRATGYAHYYSRSRGALWRKGESSGNVQRLREMRFDCDSDAVLYLVDQTGPACHTGARSCFDVHVVPAGATDAGDDTAPPAIGAVLQRLEAVVDHRLANLPEGSYVSRLHERGVGYVAQKVVEEAGETVVAALLEQDDDLLGESADLIFHLTVMLRLRGATWSGVAERLRERHREPS